MLMSYSVVQENTLPSPVMEEMKKCAEYYKKDQTFINFSDKYNGNTTYLEKLKTTLSSKFPRDHNDGILWGFIKEIIGYTGEDKTENNATLLAAPTVPKISTSLPSLSTSSSLNSSNLMLTSNLANVLFQSGKFPSATSLLGLPDPLAQSTLAANNMFLSPSLFKMQDTLNMLKPLSSLTSTLPSTSSKSETKSKKEAKPTITSSFDFGTDLNSLKSKMEFSIADLCMPKTTYASTTDLNLSSLRKMDYLASDLSISSVKPSKTTSEASHEGAPPSKVPKMDFGMLDLSVLTSKSHSEKEGVNLSQMTEPDITVSAVTETANTQSSNDQPLNLAE